ncbi:MAG: beta-ketoacyl-[acyl-carrier-protein] synthase family protein [Deltaproteobacteria bacterium]|nr:beta-ketoacyl-[acyl-carrier-protein] synthase family protein [Candidatus Anaeroferrophillacea bacterium]
MAHGYERVVVSGLGVVSPIGIGVENFWRAARDGRSGIEDIPAFAGLPLADYRCRIAGRVPDFDPSRYAAAYAGIERLDRYAQFGLAASTEAVRDAGLAVTPDNSHRVGVMVGAGMGGMLIGEREFDRLYRTLKPHRVHPGFIPGITLNSASGVIAIALGARGPNLTTSTACSSSAHALGQAMWAIRTGQAEAVVTVGADASITPLVFAGFGTLRTLSTRFNDEPQRASRPFDQLRDGFVMGEGAAALVLESQTAARRRGARIYAEVAGYSGVGEAHHMVIPREDGTEVARTISLALADAGIPPAAVDYVNAHATSTTIGDVVEVRALRRVFGTHADRLLISATKSMIGHTLGAAGAIAGVVCALTLETGEVHPTINYEQPDPECRLAGISAAPCRADIDVALLNAFGFGGSNAVVVLRTYEG